METKSFFGPEGLSSTSANYYANMAKEVARKYQNYLNNIRFYSTSISIIGEKNKDLVSEGIKSEELPAIETALKNIADLHSLIAFLREGIKEKERLTKIAKNWEDADARTEWGKKSNELDASAPVRGKYLTEEDVIKSWTVGEQEKYLSLEAAAATYGVYVHEEGPLSKARRELQSKLLNPKEVIVNGRDTIIYDHEDTTELSDVETLFFRLQETQRSVQAELNGMKKKIKDTVEAHNAEVDEVYRLEFQKWNTERNKLNCELSEIVELEGKKRNELLKEVQDLKIVIPNRLKDVFKSLQNL